MGKTLKNHQEFWTNARSLSAAFSATLLLGVSLVVNFYAGIYATMKASNAVTDIVLDNIRVYDVTNIFVYGPFFLWAFVLLLCLYRPNRIPFVLKSVALFILVRSVFITLTHIGPSIDMLNVDYATNAIHDFTFGGDLFFSAHTGLPFLMALVFAKNKWLLWLFTATSIFFGVIVLMGHMHYSIDVLAAFFITYTIFTLAKYFFKNDWQLFDNEKNPE